ncbi:MAG: hypothetical protein AAF203_09120, partial [Pseudomonadota bacterium]
GFHPQEIDFFLVQRISNHMIEPEANIDESSRQLIASMTPQEGLACIQQDYEIGALLAMTMPSLQYTRILSLLDSASIKKVAGASAEMNNKKLQYCAVKVEKIVKELRQKEEARSSAFMEKVPELIRDLGFQKEQAIFESVAEMNSMDFLINVCQSYFPAELISQLPTDILKRALDQMELIPKAELIASQPQLRQLLLDAVGGGKLQEILMVEVEEIEFDENRKTVIQRNRNQSWQSFINRIRGIIQNDEDIQNELRPLISQWGQRLSSSSGEPHAA